MRIHDYPKALEEHYIRRVRETYARRRERLAEVRTPEGARELVTTTRSLLAVAFGSFFAGLMGAVYCHYQGVASPSSYGLAATLWIIMYVLVGGINSFWGPTVGVGILLIIPEFFFRDLKGDLPYVTAAILLIIAFTMPEGIVGLLKLIRDRVFTRLRRKGVSSDAAGD